MEKQVLLDLNRDLVIEDTWSYVNEDKDKHFKLDGVLKSLASSFYVELSKPKVYVVVSSFRRFHDLNGFFFVSSSSSSSSYT